MNHGFVMLFADGFVGACMYYGDKRKCKARANKYVRSAELIHKKCLRFREMEPEEDLQIAIDKQVKLQNQLKKVNLKETLDELERVEKVDSDADDNGESRAAECDSGSGDAEFTWSE